MPSLPWKQRPIVDCTVDSARALDAHVTRGLAEAGGVSLVFVAPESDD